MSQQQFKIVVVHKKEEIKSVEIQYFAYNSTKDWNTQTYYQVNKDGLITPYIFNEINHMLEMGWKLKGIEYREE